MKYKHIPSPVIHEGEEMIPHHKIDGDIFVIGWEIGHWIDVGEGEEKHQEWEKLREEMTLTPEQEAQWQWEQDHAEAQWKDVVEAQVAYTAMMTDTMLPEGE